MKVKLIIWDLDDTLWRGTLGDKGAKFVSWEQDNETYKFLLATGGFSKFLLSSIHVFKLKGFAISIDVLLS